MADGIPGLSLQSGKVVVYQDVIVAEEKVSAAGIIEDLGMAPVTKASSGVIVNASYESVWEDNVGGRVIFSPYSGFAMHYKGDGRYLLLGDHEIFAAFTGEVGDVEIR